MICEIPNVALWGAAGNCFHLDEPEELSKIHYAFFLLLLFIYFIFFTSTRTRKVTAAHFTLP